MKTHDAMKLLMTALNKIHESANKGKNVTAQVRYLIERLDTGMIDFEGAGSSPAEWQDERIWPAGDRQLECRRDETIVRREAA